MPLTPIQRKAEFAKAAVLDNEASLAEAAEKVGASWVHVRECLAGNRVPSESLARRVAEYCGSTLEEFWGADVGAAA